MPTHSPSFAVWEVKHEFLIKRDYGQLYAYLELLGRIQPYHRNFLGVLSNLSQILLFITVVVSGSTQLLVKSIDQFPCRTRFHISENYSPRHFLPSSNTCVPHVFGHDVLSVGQSIAQCHSCVRNVQGFAGP